MTGVNALLHLTVEKPEFTFHQLLGYNIIMERDQLKIISSSSDVMGGTPVFARTRVPVQTLLDYLEAGETIDDFLEGFPTVKREQVIAFLEQAKDRMIELAK
jgi:uncharacterized protein (DUF433 family)